MTRATDKNVLYISWSWLINMSADELYKVSPGSFSMYDWEDSYYNNPGLTGYSTSEGDINWLFYTVIEGRISDTSLMIARDGSSLGGMLDEVISDDDSLNMTYLSTLSPSKILEYSGASRVTWVNHDSFVYTDELPSYIWASSDPSSLSLPTIWDVIYINRDDIVTPPHLDKEFICFCKEVLYTGILGMSAFQEGVFDNRWDNIVFDQYRR